jgi:hypothetical protein
LRERHENCSFNRVLARVSLIDAAISPTSSTQGIQQMKRKKDSREEITLIGFVDPLDDDDDNTGVKISTDNDEYIVEMNLTGKKLLNMIDEEIQATGRISLDSNGAKIFDVTNFDYAPYDENDEDAEG